VTGREVRFREQRLLPLTVERLAKAGLYYLPDAKIEDRTVCYACGKALTLGPLPTTLSMSIAKSIATVPTSRYLNPKP